MKVVPIVYDSEELTAVVEIVLQSDGVQVLRSGALMKSEDVREIV